MIFFVVAQSIFVFRFWGDRGQLLFPLLLSGGALPDTLLRSSELGPQHRDPPQVARERRDALSSLAIKREVGQAVDAERLDGGAHLRTGLAVDGDEVDVRVVLGELPEFGGKGAAGGARRDEELEDGEAACCWWWWWCRVVGGVDVAVVVIGGRGGSTTITTTKGPRDGCLEVGDRARSSEVGRGRELVPVVGVVVVVSVAREKERKKNDEKGRK